MPKTPEFDLKVEGELDDAALEVLAAMLVELALDAQEKALSKEGS